MRAVRGRRARWILAPDRPPPGDVIAALGEKLETQRACDRRGLDQPHGDAIAKAISLAAPRADQRVALLVIAEILAADGARGNEAVRAGVVEFDEKAGARGTGDGAGEGGADAIGEEMREQAIESLPFGFHGAALAGRDLRADLAERGDVLFRRQATIAEPQGADEPAMDDEVGVAADRRGEMGVAAQVESEMPVILGRIFGLCLRAQHHLVDELLDVAAFHAGEDAVELLGSQRAALRKRNIDALQEFAQ